MGMILKKPGLQERLAAACDLTLIICSDFRLNGRFADQIRRKLSPQAEDADGLEWDIIAHPGGAHRLIRESAFNRESVINDVKVLQGAHGTETVALVSHESCARYHDGDVFRYPGGELHTLRADLKESALLLRTRIPGIQVRAFIATTCPENIRMRDLVEVSLLHEGPNDHSRLRADEPSDLG